MPVLRLDNQLFWCVAVLEINNQLFSLHFCLPTYFILLAYLRQPASCFRAKAVWGRSKKKRDSNLIFLLCLQPTTRILFRCTWPGCLIETNTCEAMEAHIRNNHLKWVFVSTFHGEKKFDFQSRVCFIRTSCVRLLKAQSFICCLGFANAIAKS